MNHPDLLLPANLDALVEPLLALCQKAAELICRHYHSAEAVNVESKADDTPLTRADVESHQLLVSGLRKLTPGIPILSEESSAAELAGRRDWSTLWLVDPLDGTKEFLGRTGEFTINIALVRGDRPILGIIYRPLEDQAWVGIPGQGAWRYRMLQTAAPEPVECRQLRAGQAMVVLASRRHRGRRLGECLSWIEGNWGPLARENSGSALKFCQLAAGEGDFYPRFSLCSEWDVAAGDALVAAAGGAVLGLDGKPLRYNQRDTLLSENFIALADPGHPLWSSFLAQWQA